MRGWENLTKEDAGAAEYLARYFCITSKTNLKELEGLLQVRGLCQADAVLALLRGDYLDAAGRLTGHAVERLPPAMPPRLPAPVARAPEQARVKSVRENPIRPTTPMHARYREFRIGRTVEQLLARGLTRRDIRYACSLGHVVIE
jgi:hypothetical protein